MIPGEYVLRPEPVTANAGREAIEVAVTNTGDRPVQVGSHFHFAEANAALAFDREAAYGRRLDIPAGTAARFEPGDSRTVRLIELVGRRGHQDDDRPDADRHEPHGASGGRAISS